MRLGEPYLTELIAVACCHGPFVHELSGGCSLCPPSVERVVTKVFDTSAGNGETDLFVDVGSAALFVEVKISASFQDNQPARYAARRDLWSRREGKPARTVLAAPRAYLADKPHWASQFDAQVSLESLAGAVPDDLGHVKTALIQAVDAYGAGFIGAKGNYPELHDGLHRELARRGIPLRPSPKANTGDWVHLHCSEMKGVAFDYRIVNGVAVAKQAAGLPVPADAVFEHSVRRVVRGSTISVPHTVVELDVSVAARQGKATAEDIRVIGRGLELLYHRVFEKYMRAIQRYGVVL